MITERDSRLHCVAVGSAFIEQTDVFVTFSSCDSTFKRSVARPSIGFPFRVLSESEEQILLTSFISNYVRRTEVSHKTGNSETRKSVFFSFCSEFRKQRYFCRYLKADHKSISFVTLHKMILSSYLDMHSQSFEATKLYKDSSMAVINAHQRRSIRCTDMVFSRARSNIS